MGHSSVEDIVRLGMGMQQGLDAAPQTFIAGADVGEEGGSPGLGGPIHGGDDDGGLGRDLGPFASTDAVATSVNAPFAGGKHHALASSSSRIAPPGTASRGEAPPRSAGRAGRMALNVRAESDRGRSSF
jgi:hypothetical protein